jgi:hypothetical protein
VKLSAILAPLIAAGVAGEVILATVKAFEDQQIDALERRRQSDRDRQTKHRNNVMSRDVTVTVPSRVRLEGSSKEDIKKEEKKESAARPRGLSDFISELPSVLGSERIDALVAVRRKKGATFSTHAGKLLTRALRACPNMIEAADEMILRNWTGIKPEWLESKVQVRSGAPPPTHAERVNAVLDRIISNGKSNEPPTFDASFERRDSRGADVPLRLVAAAKRD